VQAKPKVIHRTPKARPRQRAPVITTDHVVDGILRQSSGIERCWDTHLSAPLTPFRLRRLVVVFTVDEKGVPGDLEEAGDSGNDELLECLAGVLEKVDFEGFSGLPRSVECYPFNLRGFATVVGDQRRNRRSPSGCRFVDRPPRKPPPRVYPTWQWVDAKGVIHFTDDYESVPEQYRGTVIRR
jgi:hypothetical protein